MATLSSSLQALLEKEPNSYVCKINGEWKPCKKEEICERGLEYDYEYTDGGYRIVEDDEYLDNWVQ